MALGLALVAACGRTIAVPGDSGGPRPSGDPAAGASSAPPPQGTGGSGAGGAGAEAVDPGLPDEPPPPIAGSPDGRPPDLICDPMGWCCDPMGWCCNEDLGICQGGPTPAGSGSFPGGPPPLPPPLGRADLGNCALAATTTSTGYCDIRYDCDGGSVFTSCSDAGPNWYCNCESNLGFQEFNLRTDSGIGRCDLVADYCLGGGASGGESEICTPTGAMVGPTSCGAAVECRRAIQLDGDTFLEQLDYESVSCTPLGETWSCDCNTSTQYVRFEVAFDAIGPEVCNELLPFCDSDALDVAGDSECSPISQYDDPTFCEAELECVHEARLGDLPVRVYDDRLVDCERVMGTTWSCRCQGPFDTAPLLLDGDAGWQICGRAGEECALR